MTLPLIRNSLVLFALMATLGCSSSSSTEDTQATDGDDTDGSAEGSTDDSQPFSCASGCDGTQEVAPGDCCDESCYYCTYKGAALGQSRRSVDRVCTDVPCPSIAPVQAGEPCWDPEYDSVAPSEELACAKCVDGLTCKEGRCE
jgi:hypothetical protein